MSFPSSSPSLPPWISPPRESRLRGTSQPGPTSPCPAPAPTKPQLEPFPPRATHSPPVRGPLPKPALPWHLGRTFPWHLSIQCGQPAWGRQGRRQTLGLAGPQDGCCCCFPAHKETLQGALIAPLPKLSGPFFAFPLPAPALCMSLLAAHGIGH